MPGRWRQAQSSCRRIPAHRHDAASNQILICDTGEAIAGKGGWFDGSISSLGYRSGLHLPLERQLCCELFGGRFRLGGVAELALPDGFHTLG